MAKAFTPARVSPSRRPESSILAPTRRRSASTSFATRRPPMACCASRRRKSRRRAMPSSAISSSRSTPDGRSSPFDGASVMNQKCYDALKAATDGIDKSNLPDNAKTALRGAANQLLFRLKRGIDTDKDLTQKFTDFKKRQQDHAKEKQDIAKRIDTLKGHVQTVLA